MNKLLNSLVWILAGALILIGVWLAQAASQWWLLLTFLVSAYFVISGITGHCPVKNYLRKQFGEAADDDDGED
jgi:hypothetical protein